MGRGRGSGPGRLASVVLPAPVLVAGAYAADGFHGLRPGRRGLTADFAGIDIQTVGTILIVIGVIGFAISLWFYLSNRDPAGPPPPQF